MIYYHVIIVGAKKDRIENRRGGGKPDSKQPPRGMRAIIRWNRSLVDPIECIYWGSRA